MSFRRFAASGVAGFAAGMVGLYLGAFIASHGSPGRTLVEVAQLLVQACGACPIPIDAADPRFNPGDPAFNAAAPGLGLADPRFIVATEVPGRG